MFCITLFIRIVLYLIKKEKEGKNYFPIIELVIRIIGIIVLVIGIVSWTGCIIYNYNIGKTSATIIDNTIDERKWYYPIVQYQVDGIDYTTINTKISGMQKFEINRQMIIYYNKNNPSEIKTVVEPFGVPLLNLGSFMIIVSIIGKRKCETK